MTVYVDELFATEYAPKPGAERFFGNGKQSCHLTADTEDELRRFAARMRLRPEWIQNPGRRNVHFVLVPSKRALAIRLGAEPTTGGM
jgi:hypothetical protein